MSSGTQKYSVLHMEGGKMQMAVAAASPEALLHVLAALLSAALPFASPAQLVASCRGV